MLKYLKKVRGAKNFMNQNIKYLIKYNMQLIPQTF